METPVTEGFYWARLKKLGLGTIEPEVVLVFSTNEHLFVQSPGVEGWLDLDWFEWLSPRITLEVVSRIAELEAEVARLRAMDEPIDLHIVEKAFEDRIGRGQTPSILVRSQRIELAKIAIEALGRKAGA